MLRTNSLPKNASHHVKGISHFPINNGHGGEDFCHPDTFNGLKQIGASIIRIPVGVEIGDGFIHQPDQVIQRVESAVDTAINQGFPVIICWHTDKAEQYTQHAIKFFSYLADRYKGNTHVIFEIYNRPETDSWSTIQDFAYQVIAAIRNTGSDSIVIVGTPSRCTQFHEVIAQPIQDRHVAYALQVHTAERGHNQALIDHATHAIDQGLSLYITESSRGTADYWSGQSYENSNVELWHDWTLWAQRHQVPMISGFLGNAYRPMDVCVLKHGVNPRGPWSLQDLNSTHEQYLTWLGTDGNHLNPSPRKRNLSFDEELTQEMANTTIQPPVTKDRETLQGKYEQALVDFNNVLGKSPEEVRNIEQSDDREPMVESIPAQAPISNQTIPSAHAGSSKMPTVAPVPATAFQQPMPSAPTNRSRGAISGGVVSRHGALQVVDGKIVGALSGQQPKLAGIGHFWMDTHWGNPNFCNKRTIEAMSQLGVNLFRAPVGSGFSGEGESQHGYRQNPEDMLRRLDGIVEGAMAQDRYVIIDWHSHSALKDDKSIEFLTHVAQKYGNIPNVIFEIFNEPLGGQSWHDVKQYAERAIAAIRKQGASNLIIAPTTTWSQDVDLAAQDPITMDPNIAYALHFYADSEHHRDNLRQRVRTALNSKLPIFVSECSGVYHDGNGTWNDREWAHWEQIFDEYQLPVIVWHLGNKLHWNEGSCILNHDAASRLESQPPAQGTWQDSDFTENGRKALAFIQRRVAQEQTPTVRGGPQR